MMTLQEAALDLGMSATTLRVQIRNGKLRAKKIGPIWTVATREVERYRRKSRRHAQGNCPDGHPCYRYGNVRRCDFGYEGVLLGQLE